MNPEQKQSSLHAWQLVEDAFEATNTSVQETLFSLGNGYIGLRGAHEERFDGLANYSLDATFINGFYDSAPIHHPEPAFALAKEHQFMLNVPNGKCISFSIENETFDLFQGKILHYDRTIDFRTGLVTRSVTWSSPTNKQVSVTSKRLVSFAHKNLFAIQYEIKALNFSGNITLKSGLDGRVKNAETKDDCRFGSVVTGQTLYLLSSEQNEDFSALTQKTAHSGLVLVSAVENEVTNKNKVERHSNSNDQQLEQVYKTKIEQGKAVSLTKYGVYFTSRDSAESELLPLAKRALQDAKKNGFALLCSEQKQFLDQFWHHTNIEIKGNEALEQAIHFSQFHLLQSMGRDGKTSIAAKGLTGEGYGGHYFWDAEMYVAPFFVYSKPDITRKMLEYRYSILDKARLRAREMAHDKGALYTWRTIAGEECSAFFPAGSAQYHINADIAFAIKQYYEATEDDDFIKKYGAEILLETARIWLDIGTYSSQKDNQFTIAGVTGPDEYTAIVDNNFYTNIMAQMHLKFAAETVARLQKLYPSDFARISKAIDLSPNEATEWLKAAEAMYLPYDKKLGVHPQDDTFLSKKKWDLSKNT